VKQASLVYFVLELIFVGSPLKTLAAYDLGGPCAESSNPEQSRARIKSLREERTQKNWLKVIELQKIEVREMCDNQFRWFQLTEDLLMTGQPEEAIFVLEEMYNRNFEIKPSDLINHAYTNTMAFLDDSRFKNSNVGKKIEGHKQAAKKRQTVFSQRLKSLGTEDRPKQNYVQKDICPFECCSYGEWTVSVDTPLMDQPNGTKVIGHAQKGTKVMGVTGEVHLTPFPIAIVHDHAPFSKDDIIFRLSYLGEGNYSCWYQGQIVAAKFWELDDFCLRPSNKCWAEPIESETSEAVWWVKVRLADGTEGWTDQAGNFEDIDACG
jgi:hypothetical protein